MNAAPAVIGIMPEIQTREGEDSQETVDAMSLGAGFLLDPRRFFLHDF